MLIDFINYLFTEAKLGLIFLRWVKGSRYILTILCSISKGGTPLNLSNLGSFVPFSQNLFDLLTSNWLHL